MVVLSREHPFRGTRIMVGGLVGVIGGLFMAIYEMLYFGLITDTSTFTMPNLVATLIGYNMHLDFGWYTLVGLLIQLSFSAAVGGFWGGLYIRTPTISLSAVTGILYGLLVYFIMFYLLLPPLNPLFAEIRSGGQIIAHLIFGAAFILYPPLVDRAYNRFDIPSV